MSALANSGIKETKEALDSAIEEIKELEAELEAYKSDGAIAKARATTEQYQIMYRNMKQDRDKYKKAIQDYLEGNYPHPRSYRPKDCPHGQGYWEECEQCNDEHFVKALKEVDDGH